MKKINHVVKDQLGIHARPAGLLAKLAQRFEASITIESKGKSTDAKRIMAVLGMGIKYGDEVIVTIEGNDEENADKELQKLFSEQL